MNGTYLKITKISTTLITAGYLLLFVASCGAPQPIQDSSRVRKPVASQNQGPQTGANSSNTDSQQSGQIDSEIKRFAFNGTQLKNSTRKMTGIDFDYTYGLTNLDPTTPKIKMKVTNSVLIHLGSNLGVVIAGYPLGDSSSFITSNTAANLDEKGFLTIRGENLKPATVYKFRVHFFDLSSREQSQTSQPRYLGSSSQAYQMVTDGQNDPLATGRAKIVMRGFGEVNDWNLGRYDRQKGYTQHPGGGWCHIFYNWVVSPDLKTKTGSQNTHYDPNYWSRLNVKISGNDLLALNQKELIHGDYFRVGSHAAMIIAYDTARNEFVTLEGNFNNSVQMYRRSASEMSWVGHISREMLR